MNLMRKTRYRLDVTGPAILPPRYVLPLLQTTKNPI